MGTKLTKKLIDAAEPRATRYVIWDAEILGFGLSVSPSGNKSFILKYRSLDGAQRKPTVGRFGNLTLQQAREIARDMLGEVRAGRDPSLARKQARNAPTVGELCDRFDAEHASLKKPNTRAQYETVIRKYIKPKLGDKKVRAVVTADVARLIVNIGREKPVAANRVRATLSKMFSLAERWGLRERNTNPVTDVEKFPEKKRHRDLSSEELKRLGAALIEAINDVETPCAIAAIRLLLFTGARRNEVLCLRWSEVDLEKGLLRLGDSKTGSKAVYLNSAALEVVAGIERVVGNPFVFQSRHHPRTHLTEWELRKVWEHVRDQADLGEQEDGTVRAMRLHDLRHSFASTAAGEGLSLHQIGHLLGHKQTSTTARYADLVRGPNFEAAEQIGKRLTEAMNGDP